MKAAILLGCGILVFVAGFNIKAKSESWAAYKIESTPPTYYEDETKHKVYNSTGEELSILGIVLIGVSALNWIWPAGRRD